MKFFAANIFCALRFAALGPSAEWKGLTILLTQDLRPGLQIRRRYAARPLADAVHRQIIQIMSVPLCLCGENQSRFLAALGMTSVVEIRRQSGRIR